jgi:cytoskeletal protein RodZ
MAETQVEAEQQKDEAIKGKLGSLLKSYREKNGHDIYEVAEALCLSPEIVKSLEKENFDALPEPPYIRGYLRSYAKFAGIDSQEIIDLYEQQRGADPQDLEYHFKPNNGDLNKPAISATTLRLGLIGTLLVILASISMIPAVNSWMTDTWEGFSKQTAQKNYAGKDNKLRMAENQVEIPAPLPGDEAEETLLKDSSTTATESVDTTKGESTSVTDKTAEQNSEATVDKKTDQQNKTDNDPENNTNNDEDADKKTEDEGGTKLRFVFKTDVWMRIKDKDKKVVFEGLSPAGTEKELRLQIPITFRIGNAKGIEIYIEGKYFDITNRIKGSVATFKIN